MEPIVGPTREIEVDVPREPVERRELLPAVPRPGDRQDVLENLPTRVALVDEQVVEGLPGVEELARFGVGEHLDDALERLGPSCEYALVEGYSDAALPTVALGGRESTAGELIARGDTAEDVDVDRVIERLEETEPHETLSSLVARAKESPEQDKSGAIATFTGRVREKEHDDDEPTELLEFEKYDGVAAEKMAAIREDLEAREGVYEVLLHHRTGVVESGEDIVFVVVLAGHRGEAFETVADGINRLKAEVPLFKKEVTVADEFWAHQHDTGVEPAGDPQVPDTGTED